MGTKKRILQFALVTLGSIYFFACSNAVQNYPSASSVATGSGCPTGVGGMDASCCDSTGTIISPPPSATCGVVVPGGPGVTNPINGGASAGNSVGQTTAAAAQLTGGQKGGVGFANQSAATAAQTPASAATVSGTGLPLGQSGLGLTSSGSANSGQTGNSGIGASGNIATAPGAIGGAPDPNPSASGDVGTGVGQYADSGTGGLLPNGAKATGFQFGNGFAAGDGSGANGGAEIGFGAQRNPAALGGSDPADYFTRIGLDESLFKKVEKRYRSTAANWETASLSTITLKTRK